MSGDWATARALGIAEVIPETPGPDLVLPPVTRASGGRAARQCRWSRQSSLTWYHRPHHVVMAMTLRLDEQETAALRARAEREGRSMQDVARQAVRDYIERTSKRELLDAVLDRELPRYAEALERLGQ
jgi:plasmid stability protein